VARQLTEQLRPELEAAVKRNDAAPGEAYSPDAASVRPALLTAGMWRVWAQHWRAQMDAPMPPRNKAPGDACRGSAALRWKQAGSSHGSAVHVCGARMLPCLEALIQGKLRHCCAVAYAHTLDKVWPYFVMRPASPGLVHVLGRVSGARAGAAGSAPGAEEPRALLPGPAGRRQGQGRPAAARPRGHQHDGPCGRAVRAQRPPRRAPKAAKQPRCPGNMGVRACRLVGLPCLQEFHLCMKKVTAVLLRDTSVRCTHMSLQTLLHREGARHRPEGVLREVEERAAGAAQVDRPPGALHGCSWQLCCKTA